MRYLGKDSAVMMSADGLQALWTLEGFQYFYDGNGAPSLFVKDGDGVGVVLGSSDAFRSLEAGELVHNAWVLNDWVLSVEHNVESPDPVSLGIWASMEEYLTCMGIESVKLCLGYISRGNSLYISLGTVPFMLWQGVTPDQLSFDGVTGGDIDSFLKASGPCIVQQVFSEAEDFHIHSNLARIEDYYVSIQDQFPDDIQEFDKYRAIDVEKADVARRLEKLADLAKGNRLLQEHYRSLVFPVLGER